MEKIEFYKVQASGNDFILIDVIRYPLGNKKIDYRKFADKFCRRKLGVGADGILAIEPSEKSLFKMRIFNPDGSEAEMCGNGARCAALWANLIEPRVGGQNVMFDTKAGLIRANVKDEKLKNRGYGNVRIKIVDPFGLKLDEPINILGRKILVNFINTGVPHAVIFVEKTDGIDVETIGRAVRYHNKFKPAGANINFVEFLNDSSIKIRTYERGVEDETLACGTGSMASAIISQFKLKPEAGSKRNLIKVKVKSGEMLKVSFTRERDKISDVWLEGKAHLVYKGEMRV